LQNITVIEYNTGTGYRYRYTENSRKVGVLYEIILYHYRKQFYSVDT